MRVVVDLALVASMLVVVRAVLSGVLVIVPGPGMVMGMLVLVGVFVAVGVDVRVGMLSNARVFVLVLVFMHMVVRMLVPVFMISLHTNLLVFTKYIGMKAPSV